jgi:hypothetical protein
MSNAEQVQLINTSLRPLELHLDSGVVVIDAQSDMTCSVADAESAQVKVLTNRGVLRVREPEPEQQPEADQPPPSRRRGGSGRGKAPAKGTKSNQTRSRGGTRRGEKKP